MPATDQQMQTFADTRIRVRAEQVRALINACRDDKAAITEEYNRANGGAEWADNRTDGPPKLLASLDFLVYNAFITQLLNCVDNANTPDPFVLNANFAPFLTACVRPLAGA